MTYVRTRLALDRLHPGQTLAVHLRGDEPERNVPRNAVAQGFIVISSGCRQDGIMTVILGRA